LPAETRVPSDAVLKPPTVVFPLWKAMLIVAALAKPMVAMKLNSIIVFFILWLFLGVL
jgi:hypothetical protein